jgi:hypothetical protein
MISYRGQSQILTPSDESVHVLFIVIVYMSIYCYSLHQLQNIADLSYISHGRPTSHLSENLRSKVCALHIFVASTFPPHSG